MANVDKTIKNQLLIKNGQIINAHSTKNADVYVENGVIKQIGKNLSVPKGVKEIDAAGMYVIPGGIDVHTHMELFLMDVTAIDDFYDGTASAIAGGTTCIVDFALPVKGESLLETYKKWRGMADGKVCCDYSLHVGVTWWNDDVSKEMEILTKDHGVNSFKCFLAYKGLYKLEDFELYQVFAKCRELGALPMVHAENGDIIVENQRRLLKQGITGPEGHELSRPEEVEAEATYRSCVIAKQVDSPLYVVHVMSESAADVVIKMRNEPGRQRKIIGETLVATISKYLTNDFKSWEEAAGHVVSPPLRPKSSTPQTMLKLLSSGELKVVASDHCCFSTKQKASRGKDDFSKIPTGVNGVEDRMTLTWEKGVNSGIISPNRFVEITSTDPAKIFNMYPKKGVIAVGSDADIVIWNPKKSKTISAKTHRQKSDMNIFEGIKVTGVPEYVIVKGEISLEKDQLKVTKGLGSYIPKKTFTPYIYGTEQDLKKLDEGVDC